MARWNEPHSGSRGPLGLDSWQKEPSAPRAGWDPGIQARLEDAASDNDLQLCPPVTCIVSARSVSHVSS